MVITRIITISIFQAFSSQIRIYFKIMNKWLLSFFIIGVVFLSLAAVSQSENEDEDDAVVATEEVSIHRFLFFTTHINRGG